jgi:DegV family protein with EDD domain
MKNYSIICDSACDLSAQMLKARSVYFIPLFFSFDDESTVHKCNEIESKDFYAKMRNGKTAKTSGANAAEFISIAEPILKSNRDIIYVGFSSALSMSYSTSVCAADELRKRYPERRIATIDSLCASAGIALLLDLMLEKKAMGASFDEVVSFAEEQKHKICHWFTVDNLDYLKRGGRINPGTAFFGNMLGIKPLLHVNSKGQLINRSKIRGRHATLLAMCERYRELCTDNSKIYISHADCKEDAKQLCEILKSNYDVDTSLITEIGPVIGAHCGPGTLALFFIGKER